MNFARLLRPLWLLISAVTLVSAPLKAAADEVPQVLRLASLEWLPYVGPGLAQDGLSGAVAAAVAKRIGYTAKIDYFPWTRAMQVGREDEGFAGYFPAYYTEERARQCHFSAPMGYSTLGLAYLKDKPLKWQVASDLVGMRIGVVAGYSNGAELDALVKQGRLTTDASPGDAFNLKKLLAGRVQAAVIDSSVLRYLLITEPDLMKERERISFHENAIAKLSLHVCFKRTPAGLKLQQSFDDALQIVDIKKIEAAYFQKLESDASLKTR
jgi:polar amino acid transport system substrate-binding protein